MTLDLHRKTSAAKSRACSRRRIFASGCVHKPSRRLAVAFTIIKQKLDGAINITASHNPGEYNGLKFSTPDGAPALPEVTSEIENEIVQLQQSNWEFTAKPNEQLIEKIDIGPDYLRDLSTKVDFAKRFATQTSASPMTRCMVRAPVISTAFFAGERSRDGAPYEPRRLFWRSSSRACR